MDNPESKPFMWTPELVEKLSNDLKDMVDKLINYKRNEAEARIKHIQAESEAEEKYIHATTKHNRHTLFALILFLGAIIALMSYLTLSGRVSGDALLFLVGTVTGYIIVLIQRLIFVFTPDSIPEESKE